MVFVYEEKHARDRVCNHVTTQHQQILLTWLFFRTTAAVNDVDGEEMDDGDDDNPDNVSDDEEVEDEV